LSNYLINFTLKFIKNNSNYSDEEMLKIQYGMEGILLTVTKMIVVIIIGLIFKFLNVLLLTLIFFNILRFFAFGLHAKKSWHCLVISIIEFNVLPYLLLHINIPNWFYYITIVGSFISFLLFAPSDTEKRPLTNIRKRIIRKILALMCIPIYALIAYKFEYLRVAILCSLIIESFVINPLSYKLLGLSFNNYKRVSLA